jgi:transposase
LSSKIHLECDGKARPLSLVISEGQRADSCFLEAVVDGVHVAKPGSRAGKRGRGRPRKRLGRTRLDKGYHGVGCRQSLRRRGIKHMIPEKSDVISRRKSKGRRGGRPCRFVSSEYADRNVVERCILRLKQFRRVATRYEKRAAVFEAVVTLAAIMLWIR